MYWVIYGNWIGGCLTASLFLISVFSIYRAKKEKEFLELDVKLKNRIITENEKMEFIGRICGPRFHNSRKCELEYTVQSSLRKKERKKTLKFYWGQREDEIFSLIRKFPESDFYEIRFLRLKWKDLTGMYSVKKELETEEHFLVMPKRYPLETMSEKVQKQVQKQQGFDYDGIREYRFGDRISRIHWKLFAGKGQLYVRKGEEERPEPVTILLDVSSLKKKQYSDYFSIFYSVSGFLLDEEVPQKIYFGKSQYRLNSMEQYEELFTQIFQEELTVAPDVRDEDAIRISINPQGVSVHDYLFDLEL